MVWDLRDEQVVKQAKEKFGIEIWFMDVLIPQLQVLALRGKIKGSRDDVLRTLELISQKYKVSEKRSISEKIKLMVWEIKALKERA